MKNRTTRVVLASEYPEVRYRLGGLVKKEKGSVVVGEAANSVTATTLARSLRPDVVIMDSRLPYLEGLDTVALSRVGGLDAAQAISQEIQSTRVILVSNLDTNVFGQRYLSPDHEVYLSRQTAEGSVPLTLREVSDLALQMSVPIFANVETQEPKSFREQVAEDGVGGKALLIVIENSDRARLLGIFAVIGGLGLIATYILAPIGMALAAIGAGALLLGVAGKGATALWYKSLLRKKSRRAEEAPEESEAVSSSTHTDNKYWCV
ncbi:MAG: response regulator [Dehalococcoidia bacterium]